MSDADGYIITIVALKSNVIKFNDKDDTKEGSAVYHLTVNGTQTFGTENVTIPNLTSELKTATNATAGPYKLDNLKLILNNVKLEMKVAGRNGNNETDAIIVRENTTTKNIVGGKKRSQHKYSRKR